MAADRAAPGLRGQALRGGSYLVARQALRVPIGLGGVLLLTRLIGPADYGLYAGSLAIVSVLAAFATVGTDVFLIRRATEPDRELEDQAFTLLAVTTCTLAGLGLLLTVVAPALLPDERFAAPLRVMLATVPVNVLWVPAQARLERAFRYRPLVLVELGGDVAMYGTALGLAVAGAGVWAPVAGYAAVQVWTLVASLVAARYRPRLRWSRPLLREMVGYGLGYSSATWLSRLGELVNPLVVGRFAGPAAVGQVALALRLLDTLGFVKRATSRLAVVTLAKVQDDPERLRAAHAEGSLLQVLGAGPPLAAFAFVAPWAVPLVFGGEWTATATVYPLLAATSLVGTLFNLESSALHVRRRNADVVRLRLAQLVLAAGLALVLVPRYGVVGYGLAEVGRLAAFVVVDRAVRRLFTPSYRPSLPWLAVWLPPLAATWVAWPWSLLLLVPAAVLAATPGARRQVADYAGVVRRSLGR